MLKTTKKACASTAFYSTTVCSCTQMFFNVLNTMKSMRKLFSLVYFGLAAGTVSEGPVLDALFEPQRLQTDVSDVHLYEVHILRIADPHCRT